MITEHVHKGVRYTLSNEDLANGDKVYPIAWGRCLDNGNWIFHNFDYSYHCSGFPNEPHVIIDLQHNPKYKPYEVETDHGYSAREVYFKIIKREAQFDVAKKDNLFAQWEWKEITEEQVATAEKDWDDRNALRKSICKTPDA